MQRRPIDTPNGGRVNDQETTADSAGIRSTALLPIDEHTTALYAAALWHGALIVERIEAWYTRLPDHTALTPALVLQHLQVTGVVVGYDQVALVLEAHVALGLLCRASDASFILDRVRLADTAPLRQGIQLGLVHARTHTVTREETRLVAALPAGLPANLATAWQRQASDLRAALIALMTNARAEIIIASPFWDDETVSDLEDILARRLEAGIGIQVMGRRTSSRHPTPASANGLNRLVQALAKYSRFQAYLWDVPLADDRFGSQTFHFKCIVIDHGRQAYLGSANLTSASLRSRMELGAILVGTVAEQLQRILSDILTLAQPWQGPDATPK